TPSATNTPTFTSSPTSTPSRTASPTSTATFTPSQTFTPSTTATRTPSFTRTPTFGGQEPAGSLLPAIANWLSPALRGLLSMAPPPPPALPSGSVGPCPGLTTAPSPANSLLCAPCNDPLDPIGGVVGDRKSGGQGEKAQVGASS